MIVAIVAVAVGTVLYIRVGFVMGEEVVDDWECDGSNGWHATAISRRGVGLGDGDRRRIWRNEEKGEKAEAEATAAAAAAAEERIFWSHR